MFEDFNYSIFTGPHVPFPTDDSYSCNYVLGSVRKTDHAQP